DNASGERANEPAPPERTTQPSLPPSGDHLARHQDFTLPSAIHGMTSLIRSTVGFMRKGLTLGFVTLARSATD
ncbi:MAG: hypothetical protein M3127_04210, partial [Actinomycetota bacterium]|nr:hypothetical protein [Actinomycetota bacterium]